MSLAVPDDKRLSIIAGALIGTAVGDSLGLPTEGMSRGRIQRRWHGLWQHRFLWGRGMLSDDTEHTLFVAQALLTHPEDAAEFQRCLAWKLRLWLLGLPAGIGLATLKAILWLWMGFSPSRTGVWSAGNGPAMRSAIIGVFFANNPDKRRAFVSAATRLTHTDPKAETAAQAVAEAAAWAAIHGAPTKELLTQLANLGQDAEWKKICNQLVTGADSGWSVEDFANVLGLQNGVSGYAYHSVPVALYAWLRHPGDFRTALEAALNCGGDTDTVGAIVGAIVGAQVGRRGIPANLIAGVSEWPRSVGLLEQVASQLAQQRDMGQPLGSVQYFWPGLILRNLLFLVVVLIHGFRRLLPPY